MPILLILSVAAACLPLPWPAPPAGVGPTGSLALTAAVTLAPVLAAFILSAWAVRTLRRQPDRRPAVLATYSRIRRILGFANLAAAVAAVVGLGWGWTVWHSWFLVDVGPGGPQLVPGAELLVPAPYFLALVLCWTAYYPAELALHRTSARADEPHEFWSLPGYVLFHLRQFALMVGLPVGLCVAHQGLARIAPRLVQTVWFQLASVAAAVRAVRRSCRDWSSRPWGCSRCRRGRSATGWRRPPVGSGCGPRTCSSGRPAGRWPTRWWSAWCRGRGTSSSPTGCWRG